MADEKRIEDGASGLCRLCKAEPIALTREHVPPKSTGNRGRVEVEFFSREDRPGLNRRYDSDGVALRVLCERCNTKLGSRLGTGFSDFAKQVQASGRFEAPGGGAFVSAVQVYPARILRQLYLSFICAQPGDDAEKYDDLRQYIKGRNRDVPETAPRVSLYYNSSRNYRVVPVCGVGALGRGRNWTGSEISAPGLGVLFTFSDLEHLAWLIERRPIEITSWGEKPFDHKETVLLKLPRLTVTHPHPIGFGSRREVDKWQTRKRIAWLVSGAGGPEEPTTMAALWRVSRS